LETFEHIKKVHVIFKTHLDIGFTDLSSAILHKYRNEYIPHAIRLAESLNQGGERRFIWTVGSFLIDDFLRHAPTEEVAAMEAAIRRGDITWHAMATTAHTELMDRELLDFSLSLSKDLDQRFGRTTIGAKMTDVPGHTIALVSALADAGVEYLHLGVNCASPMPHVPTLFRWQHNGKEVIVHYSEDYGTPLVIDGFDEAIEYAYTGDNTGPQNEETVLSILEKIQKKYPHAQVVASTVSDFALSLRRIREHLPVVREEIGDTWIHGCGTDPVKVSIFEDLLRLKHQWLQDGRLSVDMPFYHDFMTDLLLIAEHTWSVDIKKYLFDFTNWEKAAFQAARQRNVTDISLIPQEHEALKRVILEELEIFRNGDTTGSYAIYEEAQAEQMAYLLHALSVLPSDLQKEARAYFEARQPKAPAPVDFTYPMLLQRDLHFGDWMCRVAADGSMSYLKKGDRVLVDSSAGQETFAKPIYEIYDALTIKKTQYLYNVHLEKNLGWTEGDFGKAGLETVKDLRNRSYSFAVTGMTVEKDTLTIRLVGDQTACEEYGCPREMRLNYRFSEQLELRLEWFDKDASRIPEAVWLGFCMNTENPHRWRMQKVDCLVSPYDVVSGGNRQMHIVPAWHYDGADGDLALHSLHAPLCAVGGRGLYQLDNRTPSLENGIWYNLFNNRWGTNFKTWCEDNVSLCFCLEVD